MQPRADSLQAGGLIEGEAPVPQRIHGMIKEVAAAPLPTVADDENGPVFLFRRDDVAVALYFDLWLSGDGLAQVAGKIDRIDGDFGAAESGQRGRGIELGVDFRGRPTPQCGRQFFAEISSAPRLLVFNDKRVNGAEVSGNSLHAVLTVSV